jgi:ribulose-phosphate 3-epimerase
MTAHPLAPPIVAPSILSADFARLADELAIVDPARDWVHCDVMDHHFVPNLTFGPMIVAAVRRLTPAFVDVHLMTERPWDLAAAFRDAGADQISIHVEACRPPEQPLRAFDAKHVDGKRVRDALAAVRATGARVGLALKPATPLTAAIPFLGELDLLLVMTVEPGFGGQSFMTDMLEKIREAAAWKRAHGARWLIEVDGGIAPDTATRCRDAGAEVFVAGHAVFRQPDARGALARLRKAGETPERDPLRAR